MLHMKTDLECLLKFSSMCTEKTIFPFPFKLKGYDRVDCFPSDFEPNGIPFGSENRNVKLSPRSYPIQCERKWKYSFLSAHGINAHL